MPVNETRGYEVVLRIADDARKTTLLLEVGQRTDLSDQAILDHDATAAQYWLAARLG
jgi:hypothetical protein